MFAPSNQYVNQYGFLKIAGALTSILSVFVEPQENVVNFELLFCELEQSR